MTERELLVFLANNFRKWHGKPKEIAPGTEEYSTSLGDVLNAINATGESFSPMFVMSLFSILQQVADSTARQADEYGRFYNDPEKTLDELKREHDLKGFNEKLKQPRKKGGNATKELFRENHEQARKDWESLPDRELRGKKSKFVRDTAAKFKVSERQVWEWFKGWGY